MIAVSADILSYNEMNKALTGFQDDGKIGVVQYEESEDKYFAKLEEIKTEDLSKISTFED